jgi:phytoene synthase
MRRALGIAFQLTNIIRDVGEDARKNRIYLPVEDLQKFNVPASDILGLRQSEAFGQLMRFQAERARAHYEEAFRALPAEDRKAQRPGLIMAAIYRTLLEEIERDGFAVLHRRTSLTPLRKLWIAWKTWITA